MVASNYHPEIQRRNPFRSLDWRWQRALSLVESKSNFCKHRDDDITGHAVRYMRALHRCDNDNQRSGIKSSMPVVAQAHQLHIHGGTLAVMVQAKLLARQEPSTIGQHVNISAVVIDMFEQLFFNVRDRLDAPSYIQIQALSSRRHCDTSQQRVAVACRSLAYYGGELVLELAEEALLGRSSRSNGTAQQTSHDQLVAKIRLLATLLTLPFDKDSIKLLRVYVDLLFSTLMGSACNESPFAGVTDELVDQAVEILDGHVMEDAVEADSQADNGATENENWEAA